MVWKSWVPLAWFGLGAANAWLEEAYWRRLLLRIHFAETPWCDDTDVLAALFILQAWSRLDPGAGKVTFS